MFSMHANPIGNHLANAGATISAGLVSVSWITGLTEIMQLLATAVAIIAGMGAAWWHYEKALAVRRDRIYSKRFKSHDTDNSED